MYNKNWSRGEMDITRVFGIGGISISLVLQSNLSKYFQCRFSAELNNIRVVIELQKTLKNDFPL